MAHVQAENDKLTRSHDHDCRCEMICELKKNAEDGKERVNIDDHTKSIVVVSLCKSSLTSI